ncbi:MAG: polyamine aminopropyltransferase [Candidatus Melainabacteria bacterium]|nr:polyamine aminopropyltransferase [Candidatus Melainabacteria bacterium]
MVDLWLTETHKEAGLTVRVSGTVYSERSAFQQVDVVDTVPYGRMLLLDGRVMTTEQDEFVYHEMIVHVPMLSFAQPPTRVLVIGGGDGGTVREVLRYPSVEQVVLCEIDGLVIEACKAHLPDISVALREPLDPRLTVIVGDGIDYIERQHNAFDLIIIDSTDPMGPGEGLFTETFYRHVHRALTAHGMMTAQTESPVLDKTEFVNIYRNLLPVFSVVKPYVGSVPTYPSGMWSWAFCSKGETPLPKAPAQTIEAIAAHTRYYTPEVHTAAFALPGFVQALVAQAAQSSAQPVVLAAGGAN